MRPPSLVGRVAAVQAAVTSIALACVLVGTSWAVTLLLESRANHTLESTAERVAGLVLRPETFDRRWLEYESRRRDHRK